MTKDEWRKFEQRFRYEIQALRFSLARQRAKLERAKQSGASKADIDHLAAIVDWLEKCRQRQRRIAELKLRQERP